MSWTNRIVGSGEEDPEQLLANPGNFRIHPKVQQAALTGSLDTLGWISQVIVNRTTGHVVDGHLRVSLALRNKEKSIPVVYVELSPEEEAQALMSLDPIAAMAATDKTKLDELLKQVQTENADVLQFLADLAEREGITDGNYSRKIEPPTYSPSDKKPKVTELYNNEKAQSLIDQIELADTDDETKDFLRIAAHRHTVLRFDKIADFYSHSSPDIRGLMEASALVIIDLDGAISGGFVKLIGSLSKMQAEEYG